MKKLVLALAAFAMMYVPAHAGFIDTTFAAWQAAPVTIDDKIFTYIGGGGNLTGAEVIFASDVFPTQTIYLMDIIAKPGLTNGNLDLDYSVTATNPALHIVGLGVDSIVASLGTNFNLTKTYYSSPGHADQIAQLVSVNGSNVSVTGNFGNLVYTHVTATIPAGGALDSFRDGYTQSATVPEPTSCALLGFGAIALAFAVQRKQR
jgi:hypothetical protein